MPSYDVFISFNHADQNYVDKIVGNLEEGGISVFLYYRDNRLGDNWIKKLEAAIKDCSITAVCIGSNGIGEWQDYERQLALILDKTTVPVLLPGSTSDQIPGFLKTKHYADFRDGRNWPSLVSEFVNILHDKIQIKRQSMSSKKSSALDFYNRKIELDSINLKDLDTSYWPIISIEAPTGYGKSHFLKYLLELLQNENLKEKWCSIYIDFKNCKRDKISFVVESVTGRDEWQYDNKQASRIFQDYVLKRLRSHQSSRQGILLVFDSIEKLDPISSLWLSSAISSIIVGSYVDYDRGIEGSPVRIILAGINTENIVQNLKKCDYPPRSIFPILLHPFQEWDVQDAVDKKAKNCNKKLTPALVQNIVSELFSISGGHPGVICEILQELEGDDFLFGKSISNYFIENRERFIQRRVSPVTESILNSYPNNREWLKSICPIRLLEHNILKFLADKNIIPMQPYELYEIPEELRKIVILAPTLERPFWQNRITRRLIYLSQSIGVEEEIQKVQITHRYALEFYERWIREENIHLGFIFVEWIFHALSLRDFNDTDIKQKIDELWLIITLKDKSPDIHNAIRNAIEKDREVINLLEKRFESLDALLD